MLVNRLYLAGIVALVGCAAGASTTTGAPRRTTELTAQEIATFNVEGKSAYDMVTRLRPKWLTARGPQSMTADGDSTAYAMVFVDGRASGRPQALRDIPADEVDEIHYYDVAEANGRYGARGASGVIEVKLKRSSHQ
jgi:hypothetical protein